MNIVLKTLDDIDVTNKKVLVRVDFNVPIKDGVVDNNERIVRSLETIKELINKKAKIILISHLGRPKGSGFESKYTLKPIAEELSRVLGRHIPFANDCVGILPEQAVKNLQPGEILMLENLRFHKAETDNDPEFAQQLASLADIFVSDAFSTAHRAHASTVGISNLLPSVAGRLMEAEVKALQSALTSPQKPVVAIVGGAKVSTKLMVLHNLIKKVDYIIIGGGMGSTFLNAQGINIQKSLCEHEMKDECLKIIEEAKQNGCELVFPIDAQIATDLAPDVEVKVIDNRHVPDNYEILDAGPESIAKFKAVLDAAKTVIWNGPIGAFEIPPFNKGTNELALYIANLTKSGNLISIAGGGDTVSAIQKANVYDSITYISTAGGAFLEFMEGKDLPGVLVLAK